MTLASIPYLDILMDVERYLFILCLFLFDCDQYTKLYLGRLGILDDLTMLN